MWDCVAGTALAPQSADPAGIRTVAHKLYHVGPFPSALRVLFALQMGVSFATEIRTR